MSFMSDYQAALRKLQEENGEIAPSTSRSTSTNAIVRGAQTALREQSSSSDDSFMSAYRKEKAKIEAEKKKKKEEEEKKKKDDKKKAKTEKEKEREENRNKKRQALWQEQQEQLRAEEDEDIRNRLLYSSSDISPTKAAFMMSGANPTQDERKWFEKGAFEDGYDFGDITKTILGSVSDLSENIDTGIIGMGEKIVDAMAMLAPGAYQAAAIRHGGQQGFDFDEYNEQKKAVDEFVAKDLYDEEKVAKTILASPFNRATRLAGIDTETDSVFGEKSDSLVQSAGQLAATIGMSSVGVPWWVTTGATTFGAEAETALKEGASHEEATLSAAITAASEVLSEKISGGIKFGGKTLDAGLTKALSRGISNKFVRTAVDLGVGGVGEGLEEIVSNFGSSFGKWLTYQDEETLKELLFSEEAMDEHIEAFIGGMVLGGGSKGINAVKSSVAGVDAVTGLTANEQKVVDELYKERVAEEEAKDKGRRRKKSEIYDELLEDMEKGYITTDDIERVLGGDDYKSYRDTVDSEDAQIKQLQEQLKELDEAPNTVGNAKKYDAIQSQIDELMENAKHRDGLRAQLSKNVFDMVKNDRLRESYFEVVRSNQKFDVDLDKYEGRAKEVMRKVMESELADNSNQSHEFWDLMANLSTRMDSDITLANDEQILEMVKEQYKAEGREFDESKFKGQRIDGFIGKDGIVINSQTKRALNFVVGHEITHALEKTKHYGKFQKLFLEYAQDEYESRYNERAGQYGNKFADDSTFKAKVDQEITGDLTGDYLFTDKNFVTHLTKDADVFNTVLDEIKYMAKIATTGSQTQRQLLRVQREFERAWRARNNAKNTGNAQTEPQQSLSIRHTDGSVEELADARGLTTEQAVDYLRQAKAGSLRRDTYIPVRKDTPQVIIDTMEQVNEFVDDRSIVMKVKKAQQSMAAENPGYQTRKHGDGIRKHGLTPEQMVDIINKIDEPKAMVYQTNRKDKSGNRLPNNVAIFVEYTADGTEGTAIVEFVNPKEKDAIGREFGDVNFYTVDTIFEPDIEREGFEFDYIVDELLENPNNYLLEIKERQPEGSATGEIHPNTSNELPSFDAKIAQEGENVKFSVSDSDGNITEEQNEQGLTTENEVQYSLSRNTELSDKAIAKNNSSMMVDQNAMNEAKALRERIAERMNAIRDRGLVGLPEDIEGNTYIANSSYDGTEENTTICPRSLASEAFVDAVAEYLGRPLTVEEQIYISQDLQGRSLTPECTYCYVATDRKAYRAFLGDYIAQRDAVLQKVQENPDIDISKLRGDHLKLKNDPKAAVSPIGEVYKEFLNGRKVTEPMYNRFKMWVDSYKSGKPMIDASNLANINKLMGDINSEFGAELKPQIVDAMKYAQSASWAKKRVNYVAYNGHILNWKQDRINKLNSHYGLRMYSFSDFHPAFVLENMQMITDASVRGLKMLGYTKDTDFVEIFAPSGMNINVSTFGFEANGNIYENNIIGAEWAKAQELRSKYPNVGVTFVATNDNLVDWALEQDWIDVVIPYHLVRTGAEVAKAFGYTNYTSESADTKTKDWRKGTDKKYIAPTEHNNDKATYLAALEANHLKPRFERFIDRANYMKLVNECRQSASESKPVQPVFNEEAAMVALAKLESNGYYQPIGGSVDRMYEIAAEVAEDMQQSLAPAMSISEMGEQPTKGRGWNVYGKDILLDKGESTASEIDSLMEDLTDEQITGVEQLYELGDQRDQVLEQAMALDAKEGKTDAEIAEMESLYAQADELRSEIEARVDELFPDDLAPSAEGIVTEQQSENIASIEDTDAPVETEAPYTESNPVTVDDPFANRDIDSIGNRSIKAFAVEHPEVKPFYRDEANIMLGELRDSTKGGKMYNDDLFYRTGGEQGWDGVQRQTSDDIAYLLDRGYTYAQIENALNAIINSNGGESAAIPKRIEFLLNDRLLNGYTDFRTGAEVPPNQGYIQALNEMQTTAHNAEMSESIAVDDYAPVAETVQPVQEVAQPVEAPVTPKPTPKPKPKPVAKPVQQTKTAEILAEEPKVERKRNKLGQMLVNNLVDKGAVFETMSIKNKNPELQAKYKAIGRAESSAQYFMQNGNGKAQSLTSIREAVEKSGKTKQFYEYMYHMHNIDRMSLESRFKGAQNKSVFGDAVTADVSRAEVAKLEKANPQFKKYAQSVYRYMSELRNMMVENGIISKETANLWQKMYPHYVPIRRAGDVGLNVNVPLDSNKTGVNAPIKRATGGNSDIMPLFETMAMRTEQTFKAVANNRFGVELKNMLNSTVAREAVGVDEVIESVGAQDGLLQEGKNGQNPTFTVFENGKRVTFEITEEMYDAMKPTNKYLAKEIKPLMVANNIRRGLLTEYNLGFLATNAIKDAQDVLINSQHPIRTYAAMPEAWYEILTNGKWYQERMAHGGAQDTYFDKKTNTFAKEKSVLRRVVGAPLDAISAANNFIEQVPRMAEYIASRKMGHSIDVSMMHAARVTTDFSAGGDVTKFFNKHGVTFLNASVQGAAQHIRNIREAKANGLKGMLALGAKVAMAGLPYILLNDLFWGDDEEYEELSDYVKQNYYIVGKFGDGQFVRIPKGRALSVVQNAFEQMEKLVTGEEVTAEDIKTFGDLMITNLAPNNPLDNNLLAPIGQALRNETWYGEDLVPSRLQEVPAAEQYDESTDSISKWLGEKTNISPMKINYVLDQYSGVIGDTVLPMLTLEAEGGSDSFLGDLFAPIKDKFIVDSTMDNQNVTDFYDLQDELTVNANSMYATDDDQLKSLYMNAVSSDLADLYTEKREIQNSYRLDSVKYERVREIQDQIVELMKEGMDNYEGISYDDAYRGGGRYATIGDKVFAQNEETGEWYKLSEEQQTKYEVTSAAGDANYATDGTNHYNWYVNEDGEAYWRKIYDDQYEKQQEVTSALGITPDEYWGAKTEYDYAYKYPENYAVSQAVGGYETYRQHTGNLYDIKADKDENGDSIPYSRKDKVIDYINNLDLDYGMRLILFKNEYNGDDTYNNEIIDYINGREDLSYEQRVMILKRIGFDVDEDGNIWW